MMNEMPNTVQSNEQTFDNPFVASTSSNESNTKSKKFKTKHLAIILIAVALLLIGTGLGYLFYLNTNPVKVYQTAITNVIDDIYSELYQEYDKTNTTVKLSAKVNVPLGLFEQEIIDYINKTTISVNTQFDKEKQQMVFKVDSDYDNESLIDMAMFVSAKDEKIHLYAKDYFNKYLEVELEDYTSIKESFEELGMTKTQKANANRSKKILKKEISKLITKDDCYKKDGAFVFEVTDKEFANKLKTLITNLKDNKAFLDCFEDADTVKELFESMLESYTEDGYSNEKLIITMNKGLFVTSFDKLTLELVGAKVTLENNDNQVTYKVYNNNVEMFDGYIKTTNEKNTEKLELSANLATVGSVTIYVDTTVVKNAKVETVDASKAVKIEDLSEDEMMEIMTKIEESPLYTLISSLGFNEEDDYEDDYYNDCSGMLQYDGVSVKLNLPSSSEGIYCSNNYSSYEIEGLDVVYLIGKFDSYHEYINYEKEWLKYETDDTKYQNKVISEMKYKIINGKTYYYFDYDYDYVSFGSASKTRKRYVCTEIEKGYYLTIEIISYDGSIASSTFNSLLNFE